MSVKTIFAHVSCSNIAISALWYQELFGKPPARRPMPGLAEWQFTDSAEVQIHQQPEHAGSSSLTLGVPALEPERERLIKAGLKPGPVEETSGGFMMRLRDPDENLIVFASARKS